MARFFDSFETVVRLSEVLGADRTYDLILNNIYRIRRTLSSADMAKLYDQEYAGRLRRHAVLRKVGPFGINYYNAFVFDHLEAKADKGASVLDVGCGSGELSLALASIGYGVHGIDSSASAVRNALERRGPHSFARTPSFESRDVLSVDGRYDYIVLSDVVEHLSLQEAEQTLRKCRSLLAKKGELLIHTPNGRASRFSSEGRLLSLVSSLCRKLFRRPVRSLEDLRNAYYLQMHINVMRPAQLGRLLRRTGFRELEFHFRSPDRPAPLPILAGLLCHDMGVVCR